MSLLKGKSQGNRDACQEERIKGTFNRAKKKKQGRKKNKIAQLSLFNYPPGFIGMNEL